MTPITNTPAVPATNPPLSPEMQAELDKLLQLVAKARMPGEPPPPRTETPDERAARFLEWVNSHESRNPNMDDSRESIYD